MFSLDKRMKGKSTDEGSGAGGGGRLGFISPTPVHSVRPQREFYLYFI
jgi:hypothetical protein